MARSPGVLVPSEIPCARMFCDLRGKVDLRACPVRLWCCWFYGVAQDRHPCAFELAPRRITPPPLLLPTVRVGLWEGACSIVSRMHQAYNVLFDVVRLFEMYF